MITIDGSQGEGGGQILRSALALSMVTGKALRIERIRAGRAKPGLMRQHLTAVNAAAEVCGAEVSGAAIGSQALTFAPGAVKPGDYSFAIGTAGSATLVLQTVLPPLLIAGGSTTLSLEGGTHNPFAPPYDFLAQAFLPLINRMGPTVTTRLERAGFYPAGGGQFGVEIQPAPSLSGLDLPKRGEIVKRTARAAVSNLPVDIARRELQVVQQKLGLEGPDLQVQDVIGSRGPGNILTITLECENVTEVFTGFGERGRSAEAVAEKAVGDARRYLAAGVPVGEHLADQLLIPLALAGRGSFATLRPSRHTETNVEVIRRFLDVPVKLEEQSSDLWIVAIG